jgi:hypothetical protein
MKYTEIQALRCDGCRRIHLLSLSSVKITVNEKGRAEKTKIGWLSHLVIDAGIYDWVVNQVGKGAYADRSRDDAANSKPQEIAIAKRFSI